MRLSLLFLPIALLLLSSCHSWPFSRSERSVVRYYDSIPRECDTTQGIRQKQVIQASSDQELKDHYGLTFLVWFNDGISPVLYGTLYYQSEKRNLYCMALPDGRFAVFHDRQIDRHRRNVVHEVCYPIKECV